MLLQIHEPRTVADALGLLDGLGEGVRAYAGGTALLLGRRADLRHLVDLKSIADLHSIHREQGALVVGATVTLRDLMADALVRRQLPAVSALPGRIANARVLSAATVGGNLRLASPRTDPPVLLAALDARVRCAGPSSERELAVEELWTGTALGSADVITAVAIPVPDQATAVATARFNPRGWPTANVATAIAAQNGGIVAARVALAASGGKPARWHAAEEALVDEPLRDFEPQLPRASEIDLVDDEHGSAEYKRHLLGVLATRAARAAALDLLERSDAG